MQLQIMKAGSPSSLLLDLWSSGIWFWETVENIELSLYLRENQHCKEAPDWKFMVSRCFTCVSSCVEWRSCLAIETLQYSAKVRTTQNLKVSVYLPSLVESTAIFFFFNLWLHPAPLMHQVRCALLTCSHSQQWCQVPWSTSVHWETKPNLTPSNPKEEAAVYWFHTFWNTVNM